MVAYKHIYTYLHVYVAVVCLLQSSLASVTYQDEVFFTNLTRNYNPEIRPVFDRNEQTVVLIAMGMKSIIALDEKREVLSCIVSFDFEWTDNFLKWNITADTPAIIVIPISNVWSPTVSLYNSVTGTTQVFDDDAPVTILNTGTMSHVALGRIDTRCTVNIQIFPFDEHVCYMQVSTFYCPLSGEYLRVKESEVNLAIFDGNGEFILLSATIANRNLSVMDKEIEMTVVELVLKRQTTFYILNNILPIVFLSFLNTFAFLLPEDSGEKMSLCVSILLSYAIFLNVINSYLPENSDNVCFFSVYLAMLVLISTLTCLTTLFILALHSRLQKGKHSPNALPKKNQVQARGELVEQKERPSEMHLDVVKRCNSAAFVTFFFLTFLINSMYFISVHT